LSEHDTSADATLLGQQQVLYHLNALLLALGRREALVDLQGNRQVAVRRVFHGSQVFLDLNQSILTLVTDCDDLLDVARLDLLLVNCLLLAGLVK
jgi:hypothetical protein